MSKNADYRVFSHGEPVKIKNTHCSRLECRKPLKYAFYIGKLKDYSFPVCLECYELHYTEDIQKEVD